MKHDRELHRIPPPAWAPGASRRWLLGASAAILVLIPAAAQAQSTVIDEFSLGQPTVASNANNVEVASTSDGVDSSILGGERDISVRRLGGASDARIEAFGDPDELTFSTGGGGTFGQATIVWDGDDDAAEVGNIAFTGLRDSADGPVDLSFGGRSDSLELRTTSGDTLPLTVRIELFADAGTSAVISRTQPNGNQVLRFRFSDFTVSGTPENFDITDVGAIRLDFITASDAAGLDVDIDFVQGSASLLVRMVDQVLDSNGDPKAEPAGPGDIIRYTVTIENPDDNGDLASAAQEFAFDPALLPGGGLTTLVPGSVSVPNAGSAGLTVNEGNGAGDSRVLVAVDPVADRAGTGACPGDNSVAGCRSFSFDVQVPRTLSPALLREFAEGSFLPAQGSLTSVTATGISTTLLTNDPDIASPVRSGGEPRENLTLVAGFCGNGELDPGEGCDGGGDPDDFCTDECFIDSAENCPPDQSCPAPGCTPGDANCPSCNDTAPGEVGDDSCASGFCNPDAGVCQECGDGELDPGEGCDDGNAASGDGCSASCLIESIEEVGDCALGSCTPPPADCTPGSSDCPRCNDAAPGRTGGDSCVSGFCSQLDGVAVCMNCGNGTIDEREGCDNPGRAVSEECTASCLIASCPSGSDCDPACTITPGEPSDPSCHACTGDELCDSGDCRDSGDGGICVSAGCGDGVVDDNEGCDDGNRDSGDGCSATCLIESCVGYPDCDRDCTHVPGTPSNQQPPCARCNDEEPGRTGDDSCAGGFCDRDDGTGVCIDVAVCGNGVLEFGEGCDDGNTANGDGCNEVCRIESLERVGECRIDQCTGGDSSCTPGSPGCSACNTSAPGEIGDASCASGFCNADGFCQDCGDGDLDSFEGCDDGNLEGGDACSASCRIESCIEGVSCDQSECEPGSPDCHVCSDDQAGVTGDDSCESGYCIPGTNVCGVRQPRLAGGGCSAGDGGVGLGLGVLLLAFLAAWRRRRAVAVGVLVSASFIAPATVRAQDDTRNFSAERFKLASDSDGILGVESGTVIGHLNWDLGFWLGYADDPLALYLEEAGGDNERVDSFLTRRIGGEVVAVLGFGKRLQLGVQIPVILDQNYSFMDTALAPQSSAGLGDVSIHPKLQLLFAEDFGVDVAILPMLTVPSRGSDSYFGESTWSFSPTLAVSRQMDRVGLAGNIGYRLRSDNPEVLGLEVADEWFVRAGAGVRVNDDVQQPLSVNVSASLATSAADLFGELGGNYAEALVGADYWVDRDWKLLAGGGLGLTPGFGAPDWRVLAGLRYARRPMECAAPLVERAGACVHDCQAPYVAEGDDCVLPPCPAGYQRVGEECVIPVQCGGNPPNSDADCDGLPTPPWILLGPPEAAYDPERREPRDPEQPVDPGGYAFGHAVPPPAGEDEFPADIEQYDYCPTVPGEAKYHGCPAPTVVTDTCSADSGRGAVRVAPELAFVPGSALLSLPSRVPLEALAERAAAEPDLLVAIDVGGAGAEPGLAQRRADAVAAFLASKGVDLGQVSVLGRGDAASVGADDAATYPVRFERRCPSEIPPTTLCKELEIGDDFKIAYELNSANLQAASKEMLERDVLWILRAHPQIRVEVQGHTSGEGKLAYNMELSQRRAQSVVDFLVEHGIEGERLSAVGHGPKVPLVTPENSEADRERNRRIEFSIQPRRECGTCEKFQVGKILFEFNSGVIKEESFPELDSVVRKLQSNPAVHLLIEGHTSSEGSARYNRRLSGVRAASVRKYLVEHGVEANRLASKGVGEAQLLIAPDDTEEARETNRRVEFTITRGRPVCPD